MELWAFRAGIAGDGVDLRGMAVQAPDGDVGKVQEVVERGARTYLLVDTGPWIFGRTLTVPAGLVTAVDAEQRVVSVDRSKDEIKDAPEPVVEGLDDSADDDALTRYYAGAGRESTDELATQRPEAERPSAVPDALAPETPRSPEPAAQLETPPSLEPAAQPETPPSPEPASGLETPPTPEPAAQRETPPSPEPASGLETPPTPEPAAQPETPPRPEPVELETPPTPPARPDISPASAPASTAAPERADETPAKPSPGRARARSTERPAPRPKDAAPRRAPKRPKEDGAKQPTRASSASKRSEAPSRARSGAAPAKGKQQERPSKGSANDVPVARYDALTAAEVIARLRPLTQRDLAKVERYERRNESRQTILKRVASLREKEPWRGYDEATVAEVREKLAKANAERTAAVRDYERRHRARTGILNAARRRLETM